MIHLWLAMITVAVTEGGSAKQLRKNLQHCRRATSKRESGTYDFLQFLRNFLEQLSHKTHGLSNMSMTFTMT